MSRLGLFEGVLVALVAAITVALLFPPLTLLLLPLVALKLLITVVSGGYLIYLLSRNEQTIGRITVAASWLLVTVISWLFAPGVLVFAVIHLLMVWLVRALYFYSTLLSALADLVLTGLALLVASWAWVSAGSLFLVFWSHFLVQGLFVAIPKGFVAVAARDSTEQQLLASAEAFEKSHAVAQQALRKLFTSI